MALTPNGRVSFPSVFEATAMKPGDKPKFSVTLLFNTKEIDDKPPTGPDGKPILDAQGNPLPSQRALLIAMKEQAEAVSKEAFGVGLGQDYRGKPIKSPFRKSEEKPEYLPPGLVFVRFSTFQKPGLVDQARKPIIETSGEFYPGCWARVSYTVYSYDNTGNRGVSFGLKNIQKTGDDEAFGGSRSTPDEDFDVVGAATGGGHNGGDDDIPF